MRQIRSALLLIVLIATLLQTSSPILAHADSSRPAEITGDWASVRTFGPALAAGEIVLALSGDTWTARIADQRATSKGSPSAADFHFPDGNELRARRTASGLSGQWIQPPTVTTGYRFASPVSFTPDGTGGWNGQIHPLADVVHFYLSLQKTPDGSLSAFLRNPESNDGARIGIRNVLVKGGTITLVRQGSPDIVGRLDPAHVRMTFQFAGYPDSFVFKRYVQVMGSASLAGDRALVAANGDGWQVGTLEGVGLSAEAIDTVLAALKAPASTRDPYIQSLQIARHGKLVLDEYSNGFSIERPHDVRSAGKSITTLLVGAASQTTSSLTPQSPVYPLFPQYAPFANNDPRKQAMTVANLMTMSSGLACDDNDDASPGNEDTMESQKTQPDWYKYSLDLPLVTAPGTHAVYCSADINLLGGIITKATGRWLPDYFYDTFAAPMQFRQYAMWLTPPPLDTAYMAGGDYFLPRDFLKFGQLFLDHGRWGGKQIIDNAWLVASATPWSSLNDPGDYGYGWHLYTYTLHGRKIKAISAGGNGGQLLFIFPQLDMTVMITAANYGQYPVWQKFITQLIPEILKAAE